MDRFTAHKTVRPELLVCIHCPEHSNCYSGFSCSEIYNALSKLRYYENLEEQDRLVVLPCKVGTPVYFIAFDKCFGGKCCWLEDGKCTKEQSPEYCPQEVLETKYSMEMYRLGIRVFLTREEAEAAIERK